MSLKDKIETHTMSIILLALIFGFLGGYIFNLTRADKDSLSGAIALDLVSKDVDLATINKTLSTLSTEFSELSEKLESINVDGTVELGSPVTIDDEDPINVEGTVEISSTIAYIPIGESIQLYSGSLTNGADFYISANVSKYQEIYVWVWDNGDVDLYHSWNLHWENDDGSSGLFTTYLRRQLDLPGYVSYFEIDVKGDTIEFWVNPKENVDKFSIYLYGKPY